MVIHSNSLVILRMVEAGLTTDQRRIVRLLARHPFIEHFC